MLLLLGAVLVSLASTSVAEAQECVPACRSRFVCVAGQCVSRCNPVCAANEECTAEGECIARPTSTPAPVMQSAPVVEAPPAAPVQQQQPASMPAPDTWNAPQGPGLALQPTHASTATPKIHARLFVSGGYYSSTVSETNESLHLYGAFLDFRGSVGFFATPTIAIGAELAVGVVPGGGFTLDTTRGESSADFSGTLIELGPELTTFLAPGLFLAGSGGLAIQSTTLKGSRSSLDVNTDPGFYFRAMFGKQFGIAGVALSASLVSVSVHGVSDNLLGFTITGGFTLATN